MSFYINPNGAGIIMPILQMTKLKPSQRLSNLPPNIYLINESYTFTRGDMVENEDLNIVFMPEKPQIHLTLSSFFL